MQSNPLLICLSITVVCRKNGTDFCGDLFRSSESDMISAAYQCFGDCISEACRRGINQVRMSMFIGFFLEHNISNNFTKIMQ